MGETRPLVLFLQDASSHWKSSRTLTVMAAMMRTRRNSPPSECPVCGAEVPRAARSCPECGADEKTGWNDEDIYQGDPDLPDDSFDYEEFLGNEGLKPNAKPKGISVFWWSVAIVITAIIVYLSFFARW